MLLVVVMMMMAGFLPVNQARLDRGDLALDNSVQSDGWSDDLKSVQLENSTTNSPGSIIAAPVTSEVTKAESAEAIVKVHPEDQNEWNMSFFAMPPEEEDDQFAAPEELFKNFKPPTKKDMNDGYLIPFDDDDQGLYEYPFALPFDQSRCPPPVETTYLGILCSATECSSDSDCEGYRFCCYNGCVFTCTRITDSPPIELDWVEMGPKYPHYTVLDHSNGHIRESREGDEQEDKILLDGGCILSMKQFETLKNFSQSEDIKRCFCEKGDVLCEVRQWINPKILHKPQSISETWPDEVNVP